MTALHVEAVLTWTYAIGFGGGTIPVVIHLRHHGNLPSFLGLFDAYAGPWWPRVGRPTFKRLLKGFFAVALVASWAAWLVWNASQAGLILSFIVLPIEAVFWFGFDLPIAKIIGAVRLVLLLVGWQTLY